MADPSVIGVENVQINVVSTSIFDKVLNSENIASLIILLLIIIMFLFLIIRRIERHTRIQRKEKITKHAKRRHLKRK